jgi:predicted DNA-binding transcriptional regulator AlpA
MQSGPTASVTRMIEQDTRLLVDAEHVARMLGVPVSWVRHHTRLGDFPNVQLGRYRRYDLAAVRQWIEAKGEQ